MALKKINITSDGKMYDAETGALMSTDYGMVNTNGAAITAPEGISMRPKGIKKGLNDAINIVEWLIENWQLSILGVLALVLLFKRL